MSRPLAALAVALAFAVACESKEAPEAGSTGGVGASEPTSATQTAPAANPAPAPAPTAEPANPAADDVPDPEASGDAPTQAHLDARDAALELLADALGDTCVLDTDAIAGLLDDGQLYRAIDETGLADDAQREQSAEWIGVERIQVEVGQALCELREMDAECGLYDDDEMTCTVAASHFQTDLHFVARPDGTVRLAGIFATDGLTSDERAAEIDTSRAAWLAGIER